MNELLIAAVVLLLCVVVIAWWTNPSKRWNIDANIRAVVNAKNTTEVVVVSDCQDLFNEYCHQLKGYQGVRCFRDPGNPIKIVLQKIVPPKEE